MIATAQSASRLAPAKVNLFLHVGARRGDGYHPIASLMVFADMGDHLWLEPAEHNVYETVGPFAAALPPPNEDLVIRARDRFQSEAINPPPPFRLVLEKHLPLASGLGGGSADAAATLTLLMQTFGTGSRSERGALNEIARALGSDVAACLAGRAVIAEGRGEQLSTGPRLPTLDAVLVNPGVPSATASVFAALDRLGAPGADRPSTPPVFATTADFARCLALTRNDLEAAAITLAPVIGEALAALKAAPESLLARMSGSGATCFSLCETATKARRLAARMQDAHPGWWVRACRLA